MLVSSKDKIRNVRQVVRAGIELLAHDIEAGHPEVLSECLRAMARFHTYSFGNVLLISTQRPAATQVAGWRGWNELGRRIKQGEKGILIFAPILSELKQPANMEGEGNSNAIQPQQELLGFRPVRVFDVAQTEGRELPNSETPAISGDVASHLAQLSDFTIKQGFTLGFSEEIAPAKGTSYRGTIRLLPDMQPEETLLTLVRELAVQMLYETRRRSLVTRDVLLRESKAVVFVIANALNSETEPAENIQLYRGNLNLLAESLEVVQRISAAILGALTPEETQTDEAVQP